MINNFPDTPGIYIAQRGQKVILIKLTGIVPLLTLGKSIDITGWITGGGIKEAPKDELEHMVHFPHEWNFRILSGINVSVFPKTSFRPDGFVDIDPDMRYTIRSRYYRMLQQGIPYTSIMRALSVEYNITMDQMRGLANEFDCDCKRPC